MTPEQQENRQPRRKPTEHMSESKSASSCGKCGKEMDEHLCPNTIGHMNPGERTLLRQAIADYMRVEREGDDELWDYATTRIADLLDIKPRRDGSYNFAQFETPRSKD